MWSNGGERYRNFLYQLQHSLMATVVKTLTFLKPLFLFCKNGCKQIFTQKVSKGFHAMLSTRSIRPTLPIFHDATSAQQRELP